MLYFERLFVCKLKPPQQTVGNELAGADKAHPHQSPIIPLEPPEIDFVVPF
jgi:hypothetical protein